jgi:hypothetical protein
LQVDKTTSLLGNVGIGKMPSAETKLHVDGTIRGNQKGALRISTGQGYVDVGPQDVDWSHFKTDLNRFYFNQGITVDSGLIGSHDEDLALQTSGTTRISVLKENGNVGIGTDRPKNKLEINSEAADTPSIVGISTPDSKDFVAISSGSSTSGQNPYIAWKSDSSLRLGTANSFAGQHFSEKAIITKNGDIGIGTTPGSDTKLDVNGNVQIAGKLVIDKTVNVGDTLSDHTSLIDGLETARDDHDGRIGTLESTADTYGTELEEHATQIGSLQTDKVNKAGDGITGSLTIAGKVRIGTTDLAGEDKLKVSGTIHATEGGFKFPDGTIQETAVSISQADDDKTSTFISANDSEQNIKSTAKNQFLIKASGGVGIGKAPRTGAALDVEGTIRATDKLIIGANSLEIGGASMAGTDTIKSTNGTIDFLNTNLILLCHFKNSHCEGST